MNKKLIVRILAIALFLSNMSFAQEKINYNTTQCTFCNMVIKDQLHASKATLESGKTAYFDAIECLLNYINSNPTTKFKSYAVINYANGKFINATQATYLKSKAIKSPMGANLSAFATKSTAEKTAQEKTGKLFTWNQLLSIYNDEKVGHTNHSHHNHNRPDAHAPIGVMGDHLHAKGGFMVSLRYMNMQMKGNKSGSSSIEDATIYNSYMVAPQKMSMDMYMLGVMYAPTNKLTLMLMQNFVKNDMDLTAKMMMMGSPMPMFTKFSTSSTGLGDLKLGGLYSVYAKGNNSIHLNASLSIPVGSITEKDDTPMMANAKLPYRMQLGSGTYDVSLGATFKGNTESISWGVQPIFLFRTGTNDSGYTLGNNQQVNIWGAYKVSNSISVSARVLGINEQKISGVDAMLNPMMIPTANTLNYGGKRINSYVGCNVSFPQTSILKDVRVGLEAGLPIYENYNGIQMNEEMTFNLGLKYSI